MTVDGHQDQAEEGNLADDSTVGNAAAQEYMSNTAQIDVFAASMAAADDRYAPFRSEVQPSAQQVILAAGDLLFMPPKSVSSTRHVCKAS